MLAIKPTRSLCVKPVIGEFHRFAEPRLRVRQSDSCPYRILVFVVVGTAGAGVMRRLLYGQQRAKVPPSPPLDLRFSRHVCTLHSGRSYCIRGKNRTLRRF